ncbi:MAG: response regulator, partial [Spirochaetaceae bacterium]|nr:response regulator [Spirochaetaceae bacterium]
MRVLVVDDEKRLADSLADYLGQDGVECETAYDGSAGRARLMEASFDVVATDLRMPGLDGLELLRWVRDEGPQVPVIMMSAHGEVRDAVEAMRLGAYDYLVKPFDPDELLIRLRKASEERRSARVIEAGAARYAEGTKLVGESQALSEVRKLISKAAPAAATILITGESGTGKEVAARLVHEASGREGPFVAVNLGALPDQLVESEL